LANFLSISPNQTKLLRLFAWFQLDFPAISVSISAVSLKKVINLYTFILRDSSLRLVFGLKVHKREKFFVSDFEFFTIFKLDKLKY
jgi:hypothetical protein